jgi:phosphoadenosine phosphosulfate reductase
MTAAESLTEDLEPLTAEEVLADAIDRFHPRLLVATSFQKEASVILDMVMKIEPGVGVFTLDTGVHFPETYETWKAMEDRYGVTIEGLRGPRPERLWETDPDRCCEVRKVIPLRNRLAGAAAWVTGLRREQSSDRHGTPKMDWDRKHGLWKVNPLADWSERDVWRYILANDIPYHPLHDRGYESIGCEPCTRPGAGREGRWAGTDKLECGLHGD